jgi:hypothetical protein
MADVYEALAQQRRAEFEPINDAVRALCAAYTVHREAPPGTPVTLSAVKQARDLEALADAAYTVATRLAGKPADAQTRDLFLTTVVIIDAVRVVGDDERSALLPVVEQFRTRLLVPALAASRSAGG